MFLLVLSKDSNASSQVLREVEIAVQNNLVIIPVRIEDIMPSGGMSYYLATMQWIDIKGLDIDTKISEISQRIKSILESIEKSKSKEQLDNKLRAQELGLEPIFKRTSKKQKNLKHKKLIMIISASVLAIAALVMIFIFRDSVFKKNESNVIDGVQVYVPKDFGLESSHTVKIEDSNLQTMIISTLSDMGETVGNELTIEDMFKLKYLKIASQTQIDSLSSIFIEEDVIKQITDGIISPEETIESLKGLEYAYNLNQLIIIDQDIRDLSPIENITNLEIIYLDNNRISDLNPLNGLTNLRTLSVNSNLISDITPLKNLYKLRSLYLRDNTITDISALTDLMYMASIMLDGNNFSDINALSDMIYLDEISLSDNNISDISPLSTIRKITKLNVAGNPIYDISVLTQLDHLEWLNIGNCYIEELEPYLCIGSLKRLWIDNMNGRVLDLSFIPKLENLEFLDAHHSELKEAGLIIDLPQLKNLIIDYEAYIEHRSVMRELESKNCEIEVYDQPEDAVLSEETANENASTGSSPEDYGLDTAMVVEFENEILKDAIINTLNYNGEPVGDSLTIGELFKLEVLLITTPNNSIAAGVLSDDARIDSNFGYKASEIIDSLEGLQYAHNLEMLIIIGQDIKDLNPLSGLEKLDTLSIVSLDGQKQQINSIDALAELKALHSISITNSEIEDFTPLSGLVNLEFIFINYNFVTNISAISQLSNVLKLNLSGCKNIEDWGLLKESLLIRNLIYLNLQETNVNDLSFLFKAPKLAYLSVSNCSIEDISILINLDNLVSLDLGGTYIEDISMLEFCQSLQNLILSKNTYDNNLETINRLADKGWNILIKN